MGLEELCCPLGTPESSKRVFSKLRCSDAFLSGRGCLPARCRSPGREAGLEDGFLAWLLFSYKIISPCGTALCASQKSSTSCLVKAVTGSRNTFIPKMHPHIFYLSIQIFMFIYRSFSADKNWRRICSSRPDRKINTQANDL